MDPFKNAKSIAQNITELLSPLAEVVIHDLKSDTIVAIYNSFSKRKVGDPSYLKNVDLTKTDLGFPYAKVNFDGRSIKSNSTVITDQKGKAIGLLCINLDISDFKKMRNQLDYFIQDAVESAPQALFEDDWQERINQYVAQYCKQKQIAFSKLNRIQKVEIVQNLSQSGALNAKGGANHVASVLEISRATVYKYLKEEVKHDSAQDHY